jgi:hypothetical protein
MIPKSFTLVNRTWLVEELEKDVAEAGDRHGDCDKESALIRVEYNKNPEFREHTFYHELVHALLEASSRPSLSKKEAFVDSLAAALHQYMKTKKGKLE